MSRARKYRPGRVIKDRSQLLNEIDAERYVYLFDRPCHPSWLASMQYRTLRMILRMRGFRFAKENRA